MTPPSLRRSVRLLPGAFLLAAFAAVAPRPAAAAGNRLDLNFLFGAIGADSYTRVREFQVEGDHIDFSDLGLRTVQVPDVAYTRFFDDRHSLTVRLRYFHMRGRHDLGTPTDYNGATMAPQTLHTAPVWWSAAAFYGRSWAPGGWTLRGLVGLEFTAIDFRINHGHATVLPGSVTTETEERFLVQELPIPTLGLEAARRLSRRWVAEGAVEGNWINHWNSLRKEGGTMYLSQSKIEAHLRLRLSDDGRFARWQPMVGLFGHAFRQHETSGEDDNLIVFSAFGPEVGVSHPF